MIKLTMAKLIVAKLNLVKLINHGKINYEVE